eukprot:1915597-Amphidinium_carterae.1
MHPVLTALSDFIAQLIMYAQEKGHHMMANHVSRKLRFAGCVEVQVFMAGGCGSLHCTWEVIGQIL